MPHGISVAAVALICIFLFANGIPAMSKIGFLDFITGTEWAPSNDVYGIFPMIIGSLYVTAGAILVGVPIGILSAVFMAKFCPKRIYKPLKTMVDLLAGIPSIVYGFFGLMVLVPLVQQLFGGSGKGVLTASVLLGIMILPTIISVSEASIRAVPESYYEGALALGATKERSVFCAVVPAAKSGIGFGCYFRDWPGDWRNHGDYYGGRKSKDYTRKHFKRYPDADNEYCYGDGVCG